MTMAFDFANSNDTLNRHFDMISELEKMDAEIIFFGGGFNEHLAIFRDNSKLNFSDKGEVDWD